MRYEWRMLIGPPWRGATEDDFFDWTQFAHGDQWDIMPSDGTLVQTLNDGANEAYIGDVTGWPAGGGVWIGPNGTDEGWEYCTYNYSNPITNSLGPLNRETPDDREHNGVHTTGATVRVWWPIDTADGVLQWDHQLDDNWATTTWTAKVGGVLIPRVALRNNHLVIIQTRTEQGNPWEIELIGWLQSPQFTDDHKRAGRWTASIVSAAAMAAQVEIAGVQVGELDIANYSQAEASMSLSFPYKERYSGDFTEADPDFSAASGLKNDGKLWFAEQYVGSKNYASSNNDPHWQTRSDPMADSGFVITGIYLGRPAGYNSRGYRWIELTAVPRSDGTTSVQDCIIYTEMRNVNVFANIGEADVEPGQKIILCENEDRFMEENPQAVPKTIVEIEDWDIPADQFFDALKPTGDTIAFKQLHDTSPGTPASWQHGVSWGDGRGVTNEVNSSDADEFYWHLADLDLSESDPKPPVPDPGEAIRYLFFDVNGGGDSTDAWDYWDTSTVVSPGYTIGDYDYGDSSPNQGQIHPVYFMVNIPVLPLKLDADIEATSQPDDIIYISDQSGPNTNGLDDSGVIQIADEQIAYTEKLDDGVTGITRGHNGTTPIAHVADDAVLFVDNGVATDAPPIKAIGWHRDNNVEILRDFDVYYTKDKYAQPPTSAGWEENWTHAIGVTGNTADEWEYTLPATVRMRKVLLIIWRMTSDPARPRLDKFIIRVDDSKYTSGVFLTSGENAAMVIRNILLLAGIPSTAIIDSYTGGAMPDTVTAADMGWVVAADMADYTGIRLDVQRDSKFKITNNFFLESGAMEDRSVAHWKRSNARHVEMIYTAGPRVKQVRLAWTYGEDSGTAIYPFEPEDDYGIVAEVGPYIYPQSVAQTVARKLYAQMRYPYTFVAELVDTMQCGVAGEIHELSWQLHADDKPLYRVLMVNSMTHRITKNIWDTVLTGTQVERSSDG